MLESNEDNATMLQPISISLPSLPPNNPTYSQAVRLGNLIFVSGQLGMDPATGALAEGIQAQTLQAINNIETILKAAGASLSSVAKVTIFLTDFSLLREMNEVYAPRFAHRPAKTSVEINRLDRNALIEIEVVTGA